ncbi:SGNH/GDSL hydrolase family protein [Alicyclobacillus fastidiosus]|uniref:SGNH/GDSL hydrolase family protein n=1 Tax=Alicyclobacillus fastidiosus TaxID=392011 RepID=A0ABV5AJE3_9BACL|nr:SGNH/GDSL hydrolase family protein [Alicyclobacillus fastidiosus]WEH11556.1 SGNH/GDSL hydrolase family protein [Alicyclobacillus fastidiosus]
MRRHHTTLAITCLCAISLGGVTFAQNLNSVTSHRTSNSVTQEAVTTSTAPIGLPAATVPMAGGSRAGVLIVGASVARGWKDDRTDGGGYLDRAFRAISDVSETDFHVINKAVPGSTLKSVRETYPQWLNTYHPDLVILAWGGLNDLAKKTPLADIRREVHWEIATALAHRANVILVTSPISRASYTTYRTGQPRLFQAEIDAAKSFRSPNVHVFDVFTQMKMYLQVHRQTYVPYMGDAWHPNALGHELAAQLFLKDWTTSFGPQRLAFQDPQSSDSTSRT